MYNDYLEYFSERLIKLRMKKGVSAREMSLAMGQSKNYVAQLESKHCLPSMTAFFYICEYFNINTKDFFDDDVNSPAVYSELMNKLKDLDEEQLMNINGIVNGLLKE